MNGHIPLPGKNDNFIVSVTFEHKNLAQELISLFKLVFRPAGMCAQVSVVGQWSLQTVKPAAQSLFSFHKAEDRKLSFIQMFSYQIDRGNENFKKRT